MNSISDSVITSEADLFKEPKEVFQTVRKRSEIIYPSQFDENTGEVVFEIDPSSHSLTSFDIDLWSKWKLYDAKTDKPLSDKYPCAPINLAHFTMWEEVIVQIGNKIAFLTNGNWPWYAYFHYVYNYGSSANNSWLGESLCSAKDSDGKYNSLELDKLKPTNDGFTKRMNWLLNNREIETFGRFPFPMAQSLKMLINKVGMRITLRHAKDQFRLMYDITDTSKDPKVKLIDCKLKIIRKDVQEGLVNAYNSQLAMGVPVKYNFNRIEILGPIEIQSGQSRLDATICNGQMPLQVFMFGLRTVGAVGSALNNPFLFEPSGIKTAQCEFEGNRVPLVAYTPKFDGITGAAYSVAHEYMEFMNALGVTKNSNMGPPITMTDFAHNDLVFTFPMSKDVVSEAYTQEVPQGKTSIHLELEPNKLPFRYFFICVFQSNIEVDQDRNVKLSYIPGSAGEQR